VATHEMTLENFAKTIETSGTVVIDFWASWCGPCRAFAPTFEAASEKHEDVVFAKVDTEAQQQLAASFGIQAIPTLAIFRDQVLLFKQSGALPAAALEDVLGQVQSLDMEEVRAKIAAEQEKEGADA